MPPIAASPHFGGGGPQGCPLGLRLKHRHVIQLKFVRIYKIINQHYADDTTLFLNDEYELESALTIIENFGLYYGFLVSLFF